MWDPLGLEWLSAKLCILLSLLLCLCVFNVRSRSKCVAGNALSRMKKEVDGRGREKDGGIREGDRKRMKQTERKREKSEI